MLHRFLRTRDGVEAPDVEGDECGDDERDEEVDE